jgi:hypothetical protein
MTEDELKQRLAESVARAIRKYTKAGGVAPARGEIPFTYVDGEGLGWTLVVTHGNIDPEGVYY